MILDRGYDNTPMSAIAKTLGMTKAGVYHHFESKEDLLYSVHRRSIDGKLLPIVIAAEKIEEPELRLRTFVFEFALLMTRDPAARILINEARRLSPERFAEVRGVWRRVYDLLRDAIDRLQDDGRCRSDVDPRFAAFSALGMGSWILYWFDYDRPKSGEKVADTVCKIFMSGILNPQPRPTNPQRGRNDEQF